MAQPKNRCRRKLPAFPTRTMDLLGIGKGGQLYLWDAAAQVQPLSAFPRRGSMIVSGHYVLEEAGKAVTVHCGNMTDGSVSVQWMCSERPTLSFPRKVIEPLLLGRVIPDPVQAAAITEGLRRLTEQVIARQTAPHRKRGSL